MNNLIKHPAGTTYIHPLKKGDLITITKKYPIGDDIYIYRILL